MVWEILDTGIASAEENMRIDIELLESLADQEKPLLHFYEWKEPTVTYGHFMKPERWIDLQVAASLGLKLQKRPTGGGIVFHLWDMAFSALIPAHCPECSSSTLDNYQWIHRGVQGALSELTGECFELTPTDASYTQVGVRDFCMGRPTQYDLVAQGRKIAGAAQRRTKAGFLHQGTISLLAPEVSYLRSLLLPGTGVLEAILATSHPLLSDPQEMPHAKLALRRLLPVHLNHLSVTSLPLGK